MTDAATPTLLLVDDEQANLDLLEMVLRPRGFTRLVRVSDARRAVDAFEECRPDLVLLDLHMPHRRGMEVLADLRARTPPGDFLPVLVLTADVSPQARDEALAGGANDFVTKPFDRAEVLLRVRNLLHTRRLYADQRRARHAAERTAARERLLAEAGRVLGASLDTGTTLQQLALTLAADWADACVVDVADDGSEAPARVADSRRRADRAPVDARRSDAPHPDAPGADALRLDVVGSADGDGLIGAEDAAAALRGGAWTGAVRAPLPAGGETLGWLTAARASGREPFDADDAALAAELARRAALALANARSFRAARDALAARDQVLAVVAHDLRSPLTAVRFEVEVLRDDPVGAMDPADRATLERVDLALGRMDRLIQDLLDVSRLNRGVLELSRMPAHPAALLREAAALARPLVEGQGLTFEVRGPDDVPAMELDGARMLQAVANLVGNAAKFARHGGTVALEWGVEAGELRVAVRDDGPGIPPEQVQHIFGAFWQARHADRRGLGLGLSIARAIVEAHGGRIWAESEVGRGSTFVLALPQPPSD